VSRLRGEVTRRYRVPVLTEIIESPARGGDPTLPRAGNNQDHEWDDLVKWKNKRGCDEPWSSQPLFPENI